VDDKQKILNGAKKLKMHLLTVMRDKIIPADVKTVNIGLMLMFGLSLFSFNKAENTRQIS